MMYADLYNMAEDAASVEKNSRTLAASIREVAITLLTFLAGIGLTGSLASLVF